MTSVCLLGHNRIMFGNVLAGATEAATEGGTPVTGNFELTILIVMLAVVFLTIGTKLLFQEA